MNLVGFVRIIDFGKNVVEKLNFLTQARSKLGNYMPDLYVVLIEEGLK